MDAAVLTVGDELLTGDTTNTNAAWLGRRLDERGVAVRRVAVVPDDVEEIASVTRTFAERYDAVVVTGGLGPTHDDVTMAGVAAAFDRDVVEHPDAVAYFDEHDGYARGDLAAGTTDLPAGARMLPNEEGVAPGAVLEEDDAAADGMSGDGTSGGGDADSDESLGRVYVLPGVPDEMHEMFERVADEFSGDRPHVEVVYTERPESSLVDVLDAARERFDVGLGSYPGDGVRIRVRSTDPDEVDAAAEWLRERV